MIREGLDDILASYAEIHSQDEKLNQEIVTINRKIDKCINVCENTTRILDDATTEFNINTKQKRYSFLHFLYYSSMWSKVLHEGTTRNER